MKKPKPLVRVTNLGSKAPLEPRKLHKSLLDPAAEKLGEGRALDESGKGYLYPAELFKAIGRRRAKGKSGQARVTREDHDDLAAMAVRVGEKTLSVGGLLKILERRGARKQDTV
ncbi:MAG TPA: hypothetical protein VM074_00570 [Solimonas sp.]|nr:hypothetical protein [Solimonas sp.]